MIKTIKIDSQEDLKINTSCGFLIKYTDLFGTDFFEDLREMNKGMFNFEFTKIQKITILKIIYALAKNYDNNIDEYDVFFAKFEINDNILFEAFLIIMAEFFKINDTDFFDKNVDKNEDIKFSTTDLLANALIIGMDFDFFCKIDLPTFFKITKKYMEMKGYNPEIRQATQSDFDNF